MSRLSLVLAAAALALSPGPAVAHSLLIASVPSAEAVVNEAPTVTLRFNNRIEKKLSTIRLRDERGELRPVTVLVADGPADWLTATVSALPAGAWRVEWRVLSTDGHVVSGSFSFRVAP